MRSYSNGSGCKRQTYCRIEYNTPASQWVNAVAIGRLNRSPCEEAMPVTQQTTRVWSQQRRPSYHHVKCRSPMATTRYRHAHRMGTNRRQRRERNEWQTAAQRPPACQASLGQQNARWHIASNTTWWCQNQGQVAHRHFNVNKWQRERRHGGGVAGRHHECRTGWQCHIRMGRTLPASCHVVTNVLRKRQRGNVIRVRRIMDVVARTPEERCEGMTTSTAVGHRSQRTACRRWQNWITVSIVY